jgi:hypothetical protein
MSPAGTGKIATAIPAASGINNAAPQNRPHPGSS